MSPPVANRADTRANAALGKAALRYLDCWIIGYSMRRTRSAHPQEPAALATPHPEEPHEVRRLEGWPTTPTSLWAILRDARPAASLLRMRSARGECRRLLPNIRASATRYGTSCRSANSPSAAQRVLLAYTLIPATTLYGSSLYILTI